MGPCRVFAVLMLLLPMVHAAWISGVVWDALEMSPMQGIAVEINTTPIQREVTGAEGIYLFEVFPGEYELIVKQVNKNNELEQIAHEFVVVNDDGNYTMDLLVFYEEFDIIDLGDGEFEFGEEEESGSIDWFPYVVALGIALLGCVFFLFMRKGKKGKPELPKEIETREHGELSGDLKELVGILRSHDGRVTQKELRKLIPLSEAKVSLMIAELEDMGVVKKIKKGRGNIVILKGG
ncbi:MAG: hypothetical protein ABIG39_03115 [Candidatus Micrarchaeota archaeon]